MNPLEKLNAWLEKPIYTEGVVLYEQLIGADFLLSMLKGGLDDYNRDALLDALTGKRDALVAEHEARQAAYPPSIVDKKTTEKLLYDERTILKERLRMKLNGGSPGDQDTNDWALRILDIRDEVDGIYGERNFFDQHGYVFEPTDIQNDLDDAELLKRRNTLRTYVSKYKKLRDQATSDEQRQSAEQLLHKYQNELYQVDSELSALTKTTHGNSYTD